MRDQIGRVPRQLGGPEGRKIVIHQRYGDEGITVRMSAPAISSKGVGILPASKERLRSGASVTVTRAYVLRKEATEDPEEGSRMI
jgi:hypothetical protein